MRINILLINLLSVIAVSQVYSVQSGDWCFIGTDQDVMKNTYLDVIEEHYKERNDGKLAICLGHGAINAQFQYNRYKNGKWAEQIRVEWIDGITKQTIKVIATLPKYGQDDRLNNVEKSIHTLAKERLKDLLIYVIPVDDDYAP